MNTMIRNILGLSIAQMYADAPSVAAAPAPAPAPLVVKTEPKEFDYHFKKEKIKDEKGNKIGEGKKLPSISKVALPVPTAEGVLEILTAGGKGAELLMDLIGDTIYLQGRNIVNQIRAANAAAGTPEKEITATEVLADLNKLSWDYISNIPKAERKGLGISDEDFDAFFEDYRSIMPKVTGKDADRIEKHVNLFKKRLGGVKNDKQALGILKDMLLLWAGNTASMEDNQEVYDYLLKRCETLLAEEEKVLADAL